MSRTPYEASAYADHFVRAGYIRVNQDVRGKYGSEGDYVMMRPVRGPLNPTAVDHSTDTWDTIDWLVKHTPETNGRVGMIGSSYNGFTVVMALLDPIDAVSALRPQSANLRPEHFLCETRGPSQSEITILRSREHSTAVWLPVVQGGVHDSPGLQ